MRMVAALVWPAAFGASTDVPLTSGPKPETLEAFDRYIRLTESVLEARLKDRDEFLWPETDAVTERLRHGAVTCGPRTGTGETKVAHGLIEDWAGAVFIPGATVGEVLRVVQDYDNHQKTYHHQVMRSRVLAHNRNDFKVYLRLLKRKVITVVLDTEHEVHYRPLDEHRWQSRSYSTRIQEIENQGRAAEDAAQPKKDHGFLWRLNSYWMFTEKDGGVYVECEAVSLSRNVPADLRWLLDPILRSLPREALAGTLRDTRDALANRVTATP